MPFELHHLAWMVSKERAVSGRILFGKSFEIKMMVSREGDYHAKFQFAK
jgi:hypothetical protein